MESIVKAAELKVRRDAITQHGRGGLSSAKSASGLMPLLTRDRRPAPITSLSPARRIALIECFNHTGLHKQKGCWYGLASSNPISGGTVADLCRDGMLKVTTGRESGSAQLTEHGTWFAQTLIEAEMPAAREIMNGKPLDR